MEDFSLDSASNVNFTNVKLNTKPYYNKLHAMKLLAVLVAMRQSKKDAIFEIKKAGLSANTVYLRIVQAWEYLIKEMGDNIAKEMRESCKIIRTQSHVVIKQISAEDIKPSGLSLGEFDERSVLTPSEVTANRIFYAIEEPLVKLLNGEIRHLRHDYLLPQVEADQLRNLIEQVLQGSDEYDYKVTTNYLEVKRK